jgi:phage terminase small subunit
VHKFSDVPPGGALKHTDYPQNSGASLSCEFSQYQKSKQKIKTMLWDADISDHLAVLIIFISQKLFKYNQNKSKIQRGEMSLMASGGSRAGAGRPKKTVAEKILEGNPGKRPIHILDFGHKEELPELPENPPEYLSDDAKEIYKKVFEWLKRIGCTAGILPYNLEEYAFLRARWVAIEELNTKHGLLVKNPSNGQAIASPYVQMAHQYLKLTNEVWAKIYAVVRESKLKEYDGTSPNDSVMEAILSRNKK